MLEQFKVPKQDQVRITESSLRTTVAAIFEKMGLTPDDAADGADVLVTADLSFISLCQVLKKLVEIARPGGRLLVMVKPQFELAPHDVGKGGVVRDPKKRDQAVARVRQTGQDLGMVCLGESESVLPGPKGNLERFLLFITPDELYL